MKTRILTLIVTLLLFIPTGIQAQMKGLLKKIGQEATKSVINEKAEEKGEEANPGRGILGLFGTGEEVNHRDMYQFDGKIVMQMESYEKGKVDAVIEYTTFINNTNNDVAIEVKPISGEAANASGNSVMNMIYDQENMAVFILYDMEGEKTAIASSIDQEIVSGDDETRLEEPVNSNYTKTGKSKKIAGYNCDEYILQDDESTVNMWVTKEVPFKPAHKEMKKAGVPINYIEPFEGGMIMEMEVLESGQKQMNMVVTEIDERASKSVSMDGYTFMNVNMGGKK